MMRIKLNFVTLLTVCAFSGVQAISVPEINMGYMQERNKMKDLTKSVKEADAKFQDVISMLRTSMDAQFTRGAGMSSSEKQSELLLKEIGTYSNMELLRAEGIMMQTKELIFDAWRMSGKISKEEIEEKFQEKEKKQ